MREEDAEIVCERHTTSKLGKIRGFGMHGNVRVSRASVKVDDVTPRTWASNSTMREGQKCGKRRTLEGR